MLEAKQNTVFCYFLDFYIPNSINDLVQRGLKELVYLFQPEETTDKAGGRQYEATGLGTSKTRNIVKGVFWLAMSIVISLAIGQLGN
jgi:hypothetical protein